MSSAPPPEPLATEGTWQHRVAWLRRWLALSALALVAATWRLWTPQNVFPQVPFVAALRAAPEWLDWIGLAGLLTGLIGLLAAPMPRLKERFTDSPSSSNGKQRAHSVEPAAKTPLASDASPEREGGRWRGVLVASALLFVFSFGWLFLLDQHRFQPWGYLFAIITIVLAFAAPVRAASLLRLLAIGIYFWSAVSKLDYSFLHGIGSDLLVGLFKALQLDAGRIAGETLASLAWVFPIGELAVAVLLSIRRTRTFGLGLAVLMHVALLLILGPLGLDHEAGVLLWNVYFIGQDVLLFWNPKAGRTGASSHATGRVRARDVFYNSLPAPRRMRIEHAVVAVAVCLPVLEPFELLDHWPAWAVYAPGAERVTLLIDGTAADKLPEELRQHLGPPQFATGERVLRTDLWSLRAVAAPIYPQERFRVGVALAVIERFGFERTASVVWESRADRFDGTRTRKVLPGESLWRRAESLYAFNALPRQL